MTEARSPIGTEGESNAPTNAPSGRVWYLHGITLAAGFDAGRLAGRLPSGGEPGSLEALEAGQLAAVVRSVSAADFTPEALERRVAEAGRLEAMVLEHNAIVAAVQEERPILPAKFGSVYGSREDLATALAASHDALVSLLERLQGTDEWAVHVYVERPAVERRAAEDDPSISQLDEEIAAARPGRAYFLQRRRREAVAAGVERAAAEIGREIDGRLAPHALAGQIGSPRTGERGAGEIEVLSAAYLVRRSDLGDFLQMVDSLGAEQPQTRAEYSGPWPPYSFAAPLEESRL
jgi:hypothetical protein